MKVMSGWGWCLGGAYFSPSLRFVVLIEMVLIKVSVLASPFLQSVLEFFFPLFAGGFNDSTEQTARLQRYTNANDWSYDLGEDPDKTATEPDLSSIR